MTSQVTWLVVANTDKAIIYVVDRLKHQFVTELTHVQSRLKSQELLTGQPEHYTTPTGDAHEHEHVVFAHTLAHFLDEERKKNHFGSLIICAEPHFYGLLEQTMTKFVKELIKKHIAKDYIPFPGPKLDEAITELLRGIVF